MDQESTLEQFSQMLSLNQTENYLTSNHVWIVNYAQIRVRPRLLKKILIRQKATTEPNA